MMRSLMNQVHNFVDEEIREQNSRWGLQNHSFPVWLSILTEEVGELAQAINEELFDTGKTPSNGYPNIKEEAIQVAAVAMQIVERAYDRELSELR